ncbi:hypothetical protein T484DRAFT_1973317 [Baffinella frigidus]|nr:hypothetical protein T484DRAFT_1973317 [Cryptophyta sp. CCMP2293]
MEEGGERYDAARGAVQAYMGEAPAAEEEGGGEAAGEGAEGGEEAAEEADPDCRIKGNCHGEGYVGGALVVGTSDFSGPDRYAQGGAGPQLMQGKIGDNVIGVGTLGAAGGDSDDVMVPTRLSGARKRDRLQGRPDASTGRVGDLPADVSDRMMAGSALTEFGETSGVSDQEVPISEVHASTFKSARTQALSLK